MKNILFLIDVQKGFINDNLSYLLPRVETLINCNFFDEVIASKFINTEKSIFNKVLNWSKLSTPEQQQLAVETKNINLITNKHIYSAFIGDAEKYIRKNLPNCTLYLAGVDTDSCVLATAFSLFDAGIAPIILSDCCASTGGPQLHNAALNIMQRSFGKDNIITSTDILSERK